MKKTSHNLHLLIKSLSKQEKRYFKLFAQRHIIGEKNNYVKLFEEIDKQSVYDENQLHKIFKGEKFLARISSEKVYLYNIILKSLRAYHAEATSEERIRGMMTDISILYRKGLYPQAVSMLGKTLKQAYTYEMFPEILELTHSKIRILQATYYSWKYFHKDENSKKLFEEQKRAIKKLENTYQYQNIYSKIYSVYVKIGISRNEEDMKKLDALISHPLLGSETYALSYQAKNIFYLIFSTYYLMKGDNDRYLIYTGKRIELMEKNIHRIREKPTSYITSLNNHALASQQLGIYDGFFTYLEKMKWLKDKFSGFITLDDEKFIFEGKLHIESSYYNFMGEFDKAVDVVDKIEEGLKYFKDKIQLPVKSSFYYNISCSYIGTGNFSKAHLYINKILNEPAKDSRLDVFCSARILNLLIHYELGNAVILPYVVRSTYRFLKKKERLFKFETIMVDFIRIKIPKMNSQKKIIKGFIFLRDELTALSKDPYESKPLTYFDFISWLESKIENRPFAEIVKENASARSFASK